MQCDDDRQYNHMPFSGPNAMHQSPSYISRKHRSCALYFLSNVPKHTKINTQKHTAHTKIKHEKCRSIAHLAAPSRERALFPRYAMSSDRCGATLQCGQAVPNPMRLRSCFPLTFSSTHVSQLSYVPALGRVCNAQKHPFPNHYRFRIKPIHLIKRIQLKRKNLV